MTSRTATACADGSGDGAIEAPVVYPPVHVDRFRVGERGERLLVVSRLLPYKRVDLTVDAATRAGIGLDVVGTGRALGDLRRRAGPTVSFHGRLRDAEVTELMENCRALCLPGTENFGITPVEANAAGQPVVAFAAGGALETVQEGRTGCFFARPFSRDTFRARLVELLESRAGQPKPSAASRWL